YCLGDPALDVGNFIAHVTEQSLREMGDATALASQEDALADEFLKLCGQNLGLTLRTYTLLSLARHIYLSTLFPERQAFAAPLLELCEQRLADH
ncbi:MAG TPA: aminoglycoside phosphotransferase family protein, partial [Verrucomicrobiae bacterium]